MDYSMYIITTRSVGPWLVFFLSLLPHKIESQSRNFANIFALSRQYVKKKNDDSNFLGLWVICPEKKKIFQWP